MPFIDSHAHLADPAFDADRDTVVRAAADAGAVALICIGESRTVSAGARMLADRHRDFVYFTAGVHPYDAGHYDPVADPEWIREALAAGAVAVGECGLDYRHDGAPPERQRAVFADQIALAGAAGRPVIVHTRDAEPDTRDAVRDAGNAGVRGVLHCFTGSIALAQAALDAGWSVSFSGIVTFAKWAGDDVVRAVPDERLLVETDAPYLAPVPMRGRRNEPGYLPHVIARLAVVRGTTPEALGALVTANARRFFGLATKVPV